MVPTIAAVNGPANLHSELALLSDIVLCTPDTFFQDAGHFPINIVPGDGSHVIWPLPLGPHRGRYFLLTGQELPAQEALRIGVVGEVVDSEELLPRAYAIAGELLRRAVVLRKTRLALTLSLRRAEASSGIGKETAKTRYAATCRRPRSRLHS